MLPKLHSHNTRINLFYVYCPFVTQYSQKWGSSPLID